MAEAEAEAEAQSTVRQIEVVLELVVEAAGRAQHSKSSCSDLADKARLLSYVLPLYKPAKDNTTRRMLRKLKEAFDKSLKLVDSCNRRNASLKDVSVTTANIQRHTTWIQDWEKALILVNQAKLLKLTE